MRFWFIFAAMMGPKFFRRFIVLFALGMVFDVLFADSILKRNGSSFKSHSGLSP